MLDRGDGPNRGDSRSTGVGALTIIPTIPRQLSPTYYLDNFEEILCTVERRYGDLLSTAESAFLVDYRALDRGARCLYVRLLSRRGPLFIRQPGRVLLVV